MDCGPACLRMVSNYYGKKYSAEEIRQKCFSSREGVSLLSISDAAESMGFRALGVDITWNQLMDQAPLPAIVHWNQNHFVVVYEIRSRRNQVVVRVADPGLDLEPPAGGGTFSVGVVFLDGLLTTSGLEIPHNTEMKGTAVIMTGRVRLIDYIISSGNQFETE